MSVTGNLDLPPPVHVHAQEYLCPTCNQRVVLNIDLNRRCPECNKQIVIRRNRTSGKEFIGCSGYPVCKWTMNVRNYVQWTQSNKTIVEEERKMFIE